MTAELKESRISTRVTKLTKVDIENTAKQRNIKPSELLYEAVEAYLLDADVHAQAKELRKENEVMHRNVSRLTRNLEKARSEKASAKVEVSKLEIANEMLEDTRKVALKKYVDEKQKASDLEAEKELLQKECRKFSESTRKQRNEIANLQVALGESEADVKALANRGLFRRIFNRKPKHPKPVETEAEA